MSAERMEPVGWLTIDGMITWRKTKRPLFEGAQILAAVEAVREKHGGGSMNSVEWALDALVARLGLEGLR